MSAKKLWLDDLRPAPPGWIHVKTANDAIEALMTNEFDEVSLDHDLGWTEEGDELPSGYVVAQEIEKRARTGELKKLSWRLHTASPQGRFRMLLALENAERAWAAGVGGER